jgi:dienelactone hydrolase
MKTLLTLSFVCIAYISMAQFSIGSRTITFNDPTRTGGFGSGGGAGRQIQCEIYYPANSAGANVTVATGQFPVIVFGHGFAMAWDAYTNIWEELVPMGYILVFPRTEGGLIPGPSHGDFGLDLVVAEQRMVAEGNLSTSPFYQKLSNKNAIMGHSMGGGATILAGANNTSIKTIIGLAPAETNPSAIAAAANVTVPALILSGVQDGVTPPVDHHIPIYTALGSSCKTIVNIAGGGHCYFANSNFNCDFGESTSSSGITLTRAEQQQKMYDLITPWLAFYLKGDCDGFGDFETALTGAGLTNQRTCNYTPYTVSGTVTNATSGSNGAINLTVTNGQAPFTYSWSNASTTQNITGLAGGNYTVSVSDAFCTTTQSFTVTSSTTTSIYDETNVAEMVVFPNPTKGELTLQLAQIEEGQASVSIMDISGKLIEKQLISATNNSITLSLSHLVNGVYFIQLTTPNGQSAPVKVCKN